MASYRVDYVGVDNSDATVDFEVEAIDSRHAVGQANTLLAEMSLGQAMTVERIVEL